MRCPDYRPPDRRPWWVRYGRFHPVWVLVGLVWISVLELARALWLAIQ